MSASPKSKRGTRKATAAPRATSRRKSAATTTAGQRAGEAPVGAAVEADAAVAEATPVAVDAPARTAVEASAGDAIGLGSRLGIADVAGLHEALLRASDLGGPVRLDGGEVEFVDTAVLQLLVVHAREKAAAGEAPEWLAASPALRDGARTLGLEAHLHLPD